LIAAVGILVVAVHPFTVSALDWLTTGRTVTKLTRRIETTIPTFRAFFELEKILPIFAPLFIIIRAGKRRNVENRIPTSPVEKERAFPLVLGVIGPPENTLEVAVAVDVIRTVDVEMDTVVCVTVWAPCVAVLVPVIVAVVPPTVDVRVCVVEDGIIVVEVLVWVTVDVAPESEVVIVWVVVGVTTFVVAEVTAVVTVDVVGDVSVVVVVAVEATVLVLVMVETVVGLAVEVAVCVTKEVAVAVWVVVEVLSVVLCGGSMGV
jgi:hypothetical protein